MVKGWRDTERVAAYRYPMSAKYALLILCARIGYNPP
jgi:hypothetical protein